MYFPPDVSDVACLSPRVHNGALMNVTQLTDRQVEINFRCHVMHEFADGSTNKSFICDNGVWQTELMDCQSKAEFYIWVIIGLQVSSQELPR